MNQPIRPRWTTLPPLPSEWPRHGPCRIAASLLQSRGSKLRFTATRHPGSAFPDGGSELFRFLRWLTAGYGRPSCGSPRAPVGTYRQPGTRGGNFSCAAARDEGSDIPEMDSLVSGMFERRLSKRLAPDPMDHPVAQNVPSARLRHQGSLCEPAARKEPVIVRTPKFICAASVG